jgi:hypothetical protein
MELQSIRVRQRTTDLFIIDLHLSVVRRKNFLEAEKPDSGRLLSRFIKGLQAFRSGGRALDSVGRVRIECAVTTLQYGAMQSAAGANSKVHQHNSEVHGTRRTPSWSGSSSIHLVKRHSQGRSGRRFYALP